MEARRTSCQDAQCNSCERYKSKPKLGHIHCSVHRECVGDHQWEPDNCSYCLAFKQEYASMSTEERNNILKVLREMLKRMHRNFKAQGVDWEYRMIVSSFLDTEFSSTSSPSSVSSNKGETTPAPTSEHSQMSKTKPESTSMKRHTPHVIRGDHITPLRQNIFLERKNSI